MTDRTHPDSGRITGGVVEMLKARIADLEAQLASIGAGGVTGPLAGQPQAMPDLSQLTERGAVSWAGVDAQGLREGRWYMVTHDGVATLCEDRRDAEKEAKDADMSWPHSGPHRAVQLVEASTAGFTAADMATAEARGFRDGVASLAANAGEPVAHLWQHCETGRTRIVVPDMIVDADASWQVVGPLYLGAAPPTAPATQQAGEVRPVTPYTCPKCHALWLHWPAEQTGFGRDTLNCRSADHCHYCEKAGVEQLQRLERIPAALHAPQPSPTAQAAESVPAANERDDFEKVFPLPSGCVRVGTGYASTGYSNWAAHTHCERWQGWQARAARDPAGSVLEDAMDDDSLDPAVDAARKQGENDD